jgi:hypothetical protein
MAAANARHALDALDGQLAPGGDAVNAAARHISTPYRDAGGAWVVDELVKVNHLRNCLLCHPRSFVGSDALRGQIPTPGQEMPRIYYNSNHGNFVRADIVYLKQDFALPLYVENADPWPAMQRFDFFVRTRAATPADARSAQERARRARATLVHRGAIQLRVAAGWLQSEALALAVGLGRS